MADKTGYIGRSPGDSSVIVARQTFTPTTSTTDFTFGSGYTVGYLDLYFNGAKLIEGTDYNANDGQNIILTDAATSGDVLEAIAYKAFSITDVTDATGDFAVGNDISVGNDASISNDLNVTGIGTVGQGFNVSAGGINAVGVISATSFDGPATGLSGTPSITVQDIIAVGATFSGVLTYEDVTNVDAIGIITARSGVAYGTGIGATIFSPASNTLTLGTNSAERVRVTSAGNVGINQSVPEALLHIEASSSGASYTADAADTLILERNGGCVIDFRTPAANDGGLIFSDDSARAQGTLLYNHSDNSLQVGTAGAERLRITSAGKVGIGTDLPQEELTIRSSTPAVMLRDTDQEGSYTQVSAANQDMYFSANGTSAHANFIFRSGNAGSFVERIRITSAGIIDVNGGDVELSGTAAGVSSCTWDASANSLILKDNSRLKFGDAPDLDIWHDGSDSYVQNATGELHLRSNTLKLADYNSSHVYFRGLAGGTSELYFDNTKKLETTNAGVSITGVTTSTAGIHAGPGILRENMRGYGSAMNGAYNADVLSTGMVLNAPTNSTATFTINLRGDGSTTFNSIMNSGESTVFTAFVGQNNTSYYLTDFQIDGSSITEEWAGGTAPSEGGGSGTDIYTFTILKTANATFSVFANVTNFA